MYTGQVSFDGKAKLLDVTSDEFLDNPYKFYLERRKASRVVQIMEKSWSISGYEIANKILSHPDFGRSEDGPIMEEIRRSNPILQIMGDWMLFKNPPDHTRLRKLMMTAFTPKRIKTLEPIMREIMNELVEGIYNQPDNEFDLVSSISYPFPVSIISELMGIPQEDRHLFRKWSRDFAIALARDVTQLPDSIQNRLNQSAKELTLYFEELIKAKNGQDTDDLISTLIRVETKDDQLTNAEILSNCTLLLVAGHETTTSLISNGMNLLLDNPHQLELLRDDHSLLENAVDEILRFDPPVQSISKVALRNIEIDNHKFAEGDIVSIIIGGIGRDPEANNDPEIFDITREEINHLSFAKGIHYCLGANLAKLEAKIALEVLLKEFDHLEKIEKPIRNNNWLLRGFQHLRLKYNS